MATSSPQRPAVTEMGAPVLASLRDGARARVTVLGPVQSTTRPGASSTDGTFTVDVVSRHGRVRVGVADLSSRNQTGAVVRLRPDGASAVTATPGHPARLRVVGHYASGAAQVTLRHAGAVVAVWDFNIELD